MQPTTPPSDDLQPTAPPSDDLQPTTPPSDDLQPTTPPSDDLQPTAPPSASTNSTNSTPASTNPTNPSTLAERKLKKTFENPIPRKLKPSAEELNALTIQHREAYRKLEDVATDYSLFYDQKYGS